MEIKKISLEYLTTLPDLLLNTQKRRKSRIVGFCAQFKVSVEPSRGVQLEAFGGPEISWTSKLKFSGILRIIAIVY